MAKSGTPFPVFSTVEIFVYMSAVTIMFDFKLRIGGVVIFDELIHVSPVIPGQRRPKADRVFIGTAAASRQ
ncbi:hypothetical protein HMSSN036_42770 [Paenibacillus macerans]|nr:hypothetical protein HMSSN036_42770 [Paenibacillus macerans]